MNVFHINWINRKKGKFKENYNIKLIPTSILKSSIYYRFIKDIKQD